MSRMRETVTTVSTSRDHESNLDALLEDLQTTVSRSNSNANLNGHVSGYRSVRRTTSDGTPEGTSSEYHVEYLNPANSTQHVAEFSNSGNSSFNKYKYAVESSSDYKMKKNISELDSLLDDLNSAQKKNFSESSIMRSSSSHGIDSGYLGNATSTPYGRSIERRFREEKSVRGRSASPMRELVFTGGRSRDPSPVQTTFYEQREETPTVQQFYRYEKTTSTRTTAPTMDGTVIDTSYYPEDRTLAIKQRSPSPSYEHDHDFSQKYQGKSGYSYSSSTMRETRTDAPKTPPPHRSPSPVSFTQPPLPKSPGKYLPDPHRPKSPRFHRYSPVESHRSYNVSPPHTVYTYSSTTKTTNNHYDNQMPRPFPAVPSQHPHDQQPPKQLDELLASLGDTDARNHRYTETRYTENRYNSQSQNGTAKPKTPVEETPIEIKRVEKEAIKEDSKNVSGPPVYYPPGELFTKKEESMMMKQEGGGMYKAKGKYEYESKSKSKMKESSGKAVVPVCLPVCCAMPCSIM